MWWTYWPGWAADDSPGVPRIPKWPKKTEHLGPLTHSNRSGNLINLLKEYKTTYKYLADLKKLKKHDLGPFGPFWAFGAPKALIFGTPGQFLTKKICLKNAFLCYRNQFKIIFEKNNFWRKIILFDRRAKMFFGRPVRPAGCSSGPPGRPK